MTSSTSMPGRFTSRLKVTIERVFERIVPFVAAQPFHETLERMSACHVACRLLEVTNAVIFQGLHAMKACRSRKCFALRTLLAIHNMIRLLNRSELSSRRDFPQDAQKAVTKPLWSSRNR